MIAKNWDELSNLLNGRYPSSEDDLWDSYQSAIATATNYLWDGIPPGSQMYAMLSNNLRDAVGCADHHRARVIPAIVNFLYNEMPGGTWGSEEYVNAWMALDRDKRRDLLDSFQCRVRDPMVVRYEKGTP